jgi:F0F1-type ATP synthase membrane subunit c/vacuolar-type H+-ATPase subunit K
MEDLTGAGSLGLTVAIAVGLSGVGAGFGEQTISSAAAHGKKYRPLGYERKYTEEQ